MKFTPIYNKKHRFAVSDRASFSTDDYTCMFILQTMRVSPWLFLWQTILIATFGEYSTASPPSTSVSTLMRWTSAVSIFAILPETS